MTKRGETEAGFVVILDVLGSKQYKNPWVLYDKCNALIEKFVELLRTKLIDEVENISHVVFNDTIVISWRNNPPNPNNVLKFFEVLQDLQWASIDMLIPIRGAVSGGYFIEPEESPIFPPRYIFGSAVNDAADWYDKADWIGIILTPTQTLAIERVYSNPDVKFNLEDIKRNAGEIELTLPQYDTPLSKGGRLHARAISWPIYPSLYYLDSQISVEDAKVKCREQRKRFLSIFDRMKDDIPKYAIQKYINTLHFIDWNWQRIIELLKASVDLNPPPPLNPTPPSCLSSPPAQ